MHVAGRKATSRMAGQRTVFAMKDRGQRRIDGQFVQHRRQRPLELCFRGWFAVRSCGCHQSVLECDARIVATRASQFNEKAELLGRIDDFRLARIATVNLVLAAVGRHHIENGSDDADHQRAADRGPESRHGEPLDQIGGEFEQ